MLTPTDAAAGVAAIPDRVADQEGRSWAVTRAWPGADGAVTFEASSPDSAHVRGGRVTPADGAVLAALGSDLRLPGLAAHAETGTVVVHRPGRRAVVRTQDGSRFVKVVRPGRAADVLAAAGTGTAFTAGFTVATVLGATADTVQFQALRGRTLHDLGSDAALRPGVWDALWAEWAEAWTAVIDADYGPRDGGAATSAAVSVHDAQAEAAVVRTWATHAQRLLGPGERAAALDESANRVSALLTGSAADHSVASHRDLHDKQLLWHPDDGLGILDLDTATRAEPALDLGNLTAHLRLRHRQGLWDAATAGHAIDVVRRVADGLGVSAARLYAYDTAARFRISCVYAYRPRWAALAGRLQQDLADELQVQRAGTQMRTLSS